MTKTKSWDLLSQGEKQYWILIYQGHSKLNGNDFIPEEYLSHLKEIEDNKQKKLLEEDKKNNPWKHKPAFLGKRGRVR
mgnify:CR=1 FL=1|tara:strand:+ start:430 stop:663 length:234 start_codon:yes stop_codon:yes gene_type:complete